MDNLLMPDTVTLHDRLSASTTACNSKTSSLVKCVQGVFPVIFSRKH
ncbi:MAG: hypothetical protein ACFFD4_00630 [Candidatus Odinarchaeota archaeon]